jgi:hypothetical protein
MGITRGLRLVAGRRMISDMKVLNYLFISILLGVGLAQAFGGAAGKWDCVATATTGQKIPLTLEIKDEAGTLTGAMVLESGDRLPLIDLKAEGEHLSFKIMINDDPYQVDLNIKNNKVSGKYSGKEASGVLEGEKKA